jgi:hypothetical protein
MMDTLTLSLDSDLKNVLLALSVHGETLEDTALRLLHQATQGVVSVPDLAKDMLTHPALMAFLRCYHYNPNEKLPCGMTVGEYESLTEAAEAALWNRAMVKELGASEHTPECDASPAALTPRQRRSAARPQRSAKHRTRTRYDR